MLLLPKTLRTENWLKFFREQVSESTADQFKVLDCRGKMRLQYRPVGGSQQSLMLSFDFNKESTAKALRRIEQIYKSFIDAKGKKTLAKAATVVEASSSKHQIPWDDLVAEYRPFVPNAGEATWRQTYYKNPEEIEQRIINIEKRGRKANRGGKRAPVLPVLNKAGELMQRSKGKPTNGEDLMMKALAHWKDGTRGRQISRRVLQAFLDWAVMRGKLPAAYSPPAKLPETLKPKRVGFALSDIQILRLIDGIKDEQWRFAIQLLATFGLRPEELRYLRIKEGPQGKQLWSTFKKSKGGTKGKKTEARQLHPLFLINSDGETVDWKLQSRLEIGEPLPPSFRYDKSEKGMKLRGKGAGALGTYLRRIAVWTSLHEEAEKAGEVLVPYCFRHRYAKASHAAGFPVKNIAMAMGHSLEVHLESYSRFMPDGTADLYAKRNAAPLAA